jgi:hypothetical protein
MFHTDTSMNFETVNVSGGKTGSWGPGANTILSKILFTKNNKKY